MDKKLQEELVDSVFIAERRTGRKLDLGTVYDVLRYSLRKLEAIGKEMDYLPLLFENELRDFVMREEINCIGALSAPTTALDDEGAALAFMGIEYRDFRDYCRRMIAAALDTLPPVQGALLRLHYLEGRSLEDAAALCGMSSRQAASDTEFKGLCRLERGKYRRELRDCLEAFADYEAARLECYDRNTSRRTEAAALLHIEGGTL